MHQASTELLRAERRHQAHMESERAAHRRAVAGFNKKQQDQVSSTSALQAHQSSRISKVLEMASKQETGLAEFMHRDWIMGGEGHAAAASFTGKVEEGFRDMSEELVTDFKIISEDLPHTLKRLASKFQNIFTHTNSSEIDPRDYELAYNYLYDHEAHNANADFTHEEPMVEWLVKTRQAIPQAQRSKLLQTTLILGCANGLGAKRLHDQGVYAYGVDVAEKAIAMAKKRGHTCGPPGGADVCFKQGSLLEIPWPDKSFDAGLSADVLEHIAPEHVPQVMKEISRVVKHTLFVQIATGPERKKTGEKVGMANLHLTVQGPEWWKSRFDENGWKVKRDLSCCGYASFILEK